MIKVELHCHTNYSINDGVMKCETIIDLCNKNKINAIAITDHNEINGALKLKELAPNWLKVIIGEEIKTLQGDIIGLFINEKILPGQDIEKTIEIIKKQNGLVFVPHPFDRLRNNAVGEEILNQIKDKIDAVEVFNSRNVFASDNKKAQKWAKDNNLITFVGSDAHFPQELGFSTVEMLDFNNPDEFLINLKNAKFQTKKSSILVHLLTKVNKIVKK